MMKQNHPLNNYYLCEIPAEGPVRNMQVCSWMNIYSDVMVINMAKPCLV